MSDDRSPSPPSDRSSPTERIPSMLNMVYDTMPDTFGNTHQGMNGLAAAQQQLKTRSKMHEMAVKQRLITDQVGCFAFKLAEFRVFRILVVKGWYS